MQFLRSRAALVAAGGLILVAIVAGAAAMALNVFGGPSPTPSPSPTASPTPSPSPSPSPTPTPSPSPTPVARCPMDGSELDDPALADRVPILVQIENNPVARPPSGLNLADLVIEAPVEGDTTRFSAVFMCDETVEGDVGPVRSARYFNIDYWQQIRALTLHFGGARMVIDRFRANDMPYANGLTGGWPFFYRAGPWGAPHNVYLDVDAAREAMEDDGPLAGRANAAGEIRAPFGFDPDAEVPDGRAVAAVEIWTSSQWHFGWTWNADHAVWLRTDGGAPNSDRLTDSRIRARTVIVQVVRQEVLIGENDPGGHPRRYQHLVDSGEGVLYLDGRSHDVRWSRAEAGDVTTWTYADSGDPVILPPGKVWWEIVPVGSGIVES
jgi:hypothetical protein